MNLSRFQHSAMLALVCVLGLSAGGCNSNPEKPAPSPNVVYCSPPQGLDLDQAMAEARRTLSEKTCRYRFSDVERGLLDIAAGAPGKDNRQAFHEFYRWSADRGVITELQAKEQYTRYFTESYAAALPNDVSTCDLATRKKPVLDRLATEVAMKKQGLMQVLGDRDAWFKAKQGHDDLVFLLEGTLDACIAAR